MRGFGLFVEPDPFDVIDITLTDSLGGVLTQAVDGNAGAKFFGWVGPGVTSFTISSATDFGTGDVFSASAAPEPAAWALMLMGVGGLGAALRSRRRPAIATA